jgi:hypothetical protein
MMDSAKLITGMALAIESHQNLDWAGCGPAGPHGTFIAH